MVHCIARVAIFSWVCLFAIIDDQMPVQLGLISSCDVADEDGDDGADTFLIEVVPNHFDWETNRISHFTSLHPGHLLVTYLGFMHNRLLV